ncbi:aromatic ring-hydroxylating oxygenase subunit alpha [Ilumatobacter sp.]|uniref:aromatic ring-hydroxylating oxygenase subunit alpha n=1 Tax=Ilumatobacter sp. TaxID=1967498 RepID=UPI003B518C8F
MVHIPTRGDVPVRLGDDVRLVPDYGPSTMDADVYRDPVRFELERERVLSTHWILAGRSEQVSDTGDWLTFEGHGETVVVTRQDDGSLAAFHNVCQHRGPAIVGELFGCGARRFTCPYHGWVYDTTGLVVGVPEKGDFDPDHLDGLRSPAVAVDEWGGWVWINLAGPEAAPPLTEAIGEEIVADLGRFEMEGMVLHEVAEWDVPVSYKAIVDGFNEIYHTKALHGVDGEWVKAARQASFHILGDNYMCFVPRSDKLDDLAQDPDHHRFAICHYVVFPNTVFNCNPGHVQVFNPIPIDVDRTRFLCWELIYPGDHDDPEYASYHETTMRQWDRLQKVVGEDIAIYEQLERTKRSSGYTRNILNERECKIAHYHENMDAKIRD